MLRNVFETDATEMQALLSGELAVRIVVMGVLPAMLIWKVRLPQLRWTHRLYRRAVAIVWMLVVCVIALLSSTASYAVFFREHKPIRFALMPAAPVSSALGLAFAARRGDHGPLLNASGAAQHTTPPNARPIVLVLVVGETARAANFQLGGYERPTTPRLLATPGVTYFANATSCATSTAISVPCLFSHVSREAFDVDEASRYANLLDALQSASIAVEWRENNAGCKGVCARVQTIQYAGSSDPGLCGGSGCYDEVLVQDLPAKLREIHQDTVIVMHQMGSHGPAYAERYPPQFERFKPACHSNELQRCTAQQLVNAYDNTLVYTDHVLAQIIAALRAASDHADPLLLYVSDHGESLGEQGLYLHGLPYAFAPQTQTHVPMLMWLSPAYLERGRLDARCLEARAAGAASHDNVYHLVLGAMEVRNESYDRHLDLLAPCRAARLPADHE
jgi:lipid A ethanolaminephosphotransferase